MFTSFVARACKTAGLWAFFAALYNVAACSADQSKPIPPWFSLPTAANSIHKIGKDVLPFTLHLPPGAHPIYDEALDLHTATVAGHPKANFILFFSSDGDGRLSDYLKGGHVAPIVTGTGFTDVAGSETYVAKPGRGWEYFRSWMHGGKYVSVEIVHKPSIQFVNPKQISTDFSKQYAAAMSAPTSPVKDGQPATYMAVAIIDLF